MFLFLLVPCALSFPMQSQGWSNMTNDYYYYTSVFRNGTH